MSAELIDWFTDRFQFEMPACRIDDIKDCRFHNWADFLSFIEVDACGILHYETGTTTGQRVIQLAMASDFIRIIPRKPFNVRIGNCIVTALFRSGVFRDKFMFPFKVGALKLTTVLVPLGIGYLTYASGLWLLVSLVSMVVSWLILSRVHENELHKVLIISALESRSLFDYLWGNQLIAVQDMNRNVLYDKACADKFFDVLAAIAGCNTSQVISREAIMSNLLKKYQRKDMAR